MKATSRESGLCPRVPKTACHAHSTLQRALDTQRKISLIDIVTEQRNTRVECVTNSACLKLFSGVLQSSMVFLELLMQMYLPIPSCRFDPSIVTYRPQAHFSYRRLFALESASFGVIVVLFPLIDDGQSVSTMLFALDHEMENSQKTMSIGRRRSLAYLELLSDQLPQMRTCVVCERASRAHGRDFSCP
jgi:hypothetical protein